MSTASEEEEKGNAEAETETLVNSLTQLQEAYKEEWQQQLQWIRSTSWKAEMPSPTSAVSPQAAEESAGAFGIEGGQSFTGGVDWEWVWVCLRIAVLHTCPNLRSPQPSPEASAPATS